MEKFTSREMMAIAAARLIKDNEIVFCGTGISLLAAMAAKYIHAPRAIIFFETGALDPDLKEIPLTVADSRLMVGSCVNTGLFDTFSLMQNPFFGFRIIGILGAAQIDCYGNLNSTCLGEYKNPSRRFPGSGGAGDAGSFVGRLMVFVKHELRRFVKKLDYFTTPGYFSGPGEREKQGCSPGGPEWVISDKALLGFDQQSKQMFLRGFFPGTSPADIQKNTGFFIEVGQAEPIRPPSKEELEILRCQVDPQRLIL
jgi:glutaconate CoA-transferase subunit B